MVKIKAIRFKIHLFIFAMFIIFNFLDQPSPFIKFCIFSINNDQFLLQNSSQKSQMHLYPDENTCLQLYFGKNFQKVKTLRSQTD